MEHGMCLVIEDFIRVYQTQLWNAVYVSSAPEIGDVQIFINAVTTTLQRESSSVVTLS